MIKQQKKVILQALLDNYKGKNENNVCKNGYETEKDESCDKCSVCQKNGIKSPVKKVESKLNLETPPPKPAIDSSDNIFENT